MRRGQQDRIRESSHGVHLRTDTVSRGIAGVSAISSKRRRNFPRRWLILLRKARQNFDPAHDAEGLVLVAAQFLMCLWKPSHFERRPALFTNPSRIGGARGASKAE